MDETEAQEAQSVQCLDRKRVPFHLRSIINEKKEEDIDMTNTILKIQGLDLSETMSIVNIDSLNKLYALQLESELIFETPLEYFLLKENMAFRFVKPEAKPKTLHAEEVFLNPDRWGAKVTLEPDELLKFALLNNVHVFETASEFVVPAAVTMVAPKKRTTRTVLSGLDRDYLGS